MKDIVKKSMLCALDGIENRKNSHELFGYDFMIDEDFKVWLIQVNSSPSMDYSTVFKYFYLACDNKTRKIGSY